MAEDGGQARGLRARRQRERQAPVTDPDGRRPAPADGLRARPGRTQEQIAHGAEALRRLKPQEVRALVLRAEGYTYRRDLRAHRVDLHEAEPSADRGSPGLPDPTGGHRGRDRVRAARAAASRLADGEASADELAALRPHLKSCLTCRARLKEFRAPPATSLRWPPSARSPRRTETLAAARCAASSSRSLARCNTRRPPSATAPTLRPSWSPARRSPPSQRQPRRWPAAARRSASSPAIRSTARAHHSARRSGEPSRPTRTDQPVQPTTTQTTTSRAASPASPSSPSATHAAARPRQRVRPHGGRSVRRNTVLVIDHPTRPTRHDRQLQPERYGERQRPRQRAGRVHALSRCRVSLLVVAKSSKCPAPPANTHPRRGARDVIDAPGSRERWSDVVSPPTDAGTPPRYAAPRCRPGTTCSRSPGPARGRAGDLLRHAGAEGAQEVHVPAAHQAGCTGDAGDRYAGAGGAGQGPARRLLPHPALRGLALRPRSASTRSTARCSPS